MMFFEFVKIPLVEQQQFPRNPLQILQNEAVLGVLRQIWENNHINLTDPQSFAGEFFTFLKNKANEDAINPEELRVFYEQKLKEYKIPGRKGEKTQDILEKAMAADLGQAQKILDFGCGKLTLLKMVAENHPQLVELVGVDAGSAPSMINLDERIKFVRTAGDNIPLETGQFDVVVSKLVFHHLADEAMILNFFREIKRVLRPSGKFYFFEETFSEQVTDLNASEKYLQQFGLRMNVRVTEDFLQLAEVDKLQLLFLNDWLMNLKNLSYMPWSFQYKTLEEWTRLAETAGLQKTEEHFIGVLAEKKRKQGVSALLVFV